MVRTIAGTKLVGSPVRFDGERTDSELPPPMLGQHTDEILASLGLSAADVAELKSEGVAS
jgi:crotonobetainyl-CoA:carnitine CoA-transferase CaiB-like acyl-CoA transferase